MSSLTHAALRRLARRHPWAALQLARTAAHGLLRYRRLTFKHYGGEEYVRARAADGEYRYRAQVEEAGKLAAAAVDLWQLRRRLLRAGVRCPRRRPAPDYTAHDVPNPHAPHLGGHGVWSSVGRYVGRPGWRCEVECYPPDAERSQWVACRSWRSEDQARRWVARVRAACLRLVELVQAENAAAA